ncbi:MAG: ATP-binding cassette domain-containing protein [Defluviitaleaceae bacterium]|nr:ATP-binding cassette domain-containing protein [Defluviitaleaceae bacterium]
MIIVNNISKAYGEKKVLQGFSYKFETGITCVAGPSGCGKTTLANIIAELVIPDTGNVMDAGVVSYVFQEDRLLKWESSITNLMLVTKDRQRAQALLTQAKLGDVMQKKIKKLSGGMQRRVAICRGLVANYQTLILDEPFKGLDKDTKETIMDMVKKESENKVVILITHDEKEINHMSDNVLYLQN